MKFHRLIGALSLILVSCVVGLARAGTGTAVISFTRPTAYTDGTALPLSDLAQYDIQCTFKDKGATAAVPCIAQSVPFFSGNATGGSVSFTMGSAGGDACFAVRSVTIAGGVSPWTAPVCRTFAAATPSWPGNVTVTIAVSVQ